MKITNRRPVRHGSGLEKKLSSYALAGAALLAGPAAAHASSITTVPVNQTFTFNGVTPETYTLTFPLSTDTVVITAQTPNAGATNDVDASVTGSAMILNAADIFNVQTPAALGNDFVIDPTSGNWGTGGKMVAFGVRSTGGGNWSTSGGTNFLGFDFTETDGVHTGWAQISTSADVNGSSFTIFDYAYNTVANAPITTPTPEPSTMSLIALGAAGLLALRRRRSGNA